MYYSLKTKRIDLGILANIKANYAASQLSRIKRKRRRKRTLLRFDEANRILIVFAWKDELSFEYLSNVVGEMKNECPQADFQLLCYYRYRSKKLPDLLQSEKILVLQRSGINFLGVPKKQFMNQLLKEEYDILADFTFHNYRELLFSVGAANARLKTGPDLPGRKNYYDIMIGLREGDRLIDFANNIIHYLKVFKSKNS